MSTIPDAGCPAFSKTAALFKATSQCHHAIKPHSPARLCNLGIEIPSGKATGQTHHWHTGHSARGSCTHSYVSAQLISPEWSVIPHLTLEGESWMCPVLMPFHINVMRVRDEEDNLLCSITHANHMKPHMIKHLCSLQRWSKMGGMTPSHYSPWQKRFLGSSMI